ncbi:hypothetical protein D9758_015257 [Tetrapyrgos nigripes]|uniref:Uncharacterized protein n=1 Tax=Tetrapyrgos nigripes TaxID=182062 RepID=A0A8H5FEP5_9AGAR|nr:hypothetical protein D9758_015257 [Tetrapyrgos nigripes]
MDGGVMDGDFNWNGAWPVELTTASQGSSDTSLSSALTDLLGLSGPTSAPDATNIIPHLSTFLGGFLGGSSDDTNSPNSNVASKQTTDVTQQTQAKTLASALSKFIGSTDGDLLHVKGLGLTGGFPSKRWFASSPSESDNESTNWFSFPFQRKRDVERDEGQGNEKIYMASVSPWSLPTLFLYTADQHLYAKRWEALVNSSFPTNSNSPSNPLNIDIIQIISWNDYGESHYISPIKGAQPTGREAWTGGMGHAAWLPLTSYYASAFKNGDPVEDTVWVITLLAEPANVTFEVYAYTPSSSSSSSSNATTTADADVDNKIISSQTISVPAGLSRLAMPIGFPDAGGDGGIQSLSVRARVVRSGSASGSGSSSESQDTTDTLVMQLDAGNPNHSSNAGDSDSNTNAGNGDAQGQGDGTGNGDGDAQTLAPFVFVKNPGKYNYNAWVGCVSSSGRGVDFGFMVLWGGGTKSAHALLVERAFFMSLMTVMTMI